MLVGSLFSGIGGLDLGFERAGFTIAWQVEIDPYCRKVLAKHWPLVPCYEDIRDVGAHNLAPVDVLVGGFPCQPVSLTGHRRGQEDERWLWPDYARLICELRPRYAVMENVPGLLSRGFGDVLRDLAEGGHDAEWQVLPASAFGAPHDRARVWIVAYPGGGGMGIFTGRKAVADIHRNVAEVTRGRHAGTAWATSVGFAGSPTELVQHARSLRADDGISNRMDRHRALGNAVVPQVAQYVAECIREHALCS